MKWSYLFVVSILIVGCALNSAERKKPTEDSGNQPASKLLKPNKKRALDPGVESIIVEEGKDVILQAPLLQKANYQWFTNDVEIAGEDSDTLEIKSVDQSKLLVYSVNVEKRGEVERVMKAVLIMVKFDAPKRGVGNAGALTVPVTACSMTSVLVGGTSFTNAFSLAGSGSAPQLFYGKKYSPANAESGPYANTPGYPTLKIWLELGENPGLSAAAVQLKSNYLPIKEIDKNVATSGAAGIDVPIDYAYTYRGGIFYNGAPTRGYLLWHFQYHN